MSLNWIDWSIIIFITVSIAYSCIKGGFKSVFALCTWVAGIYLAINFYPRVALWLTGVIKSESTRSVVAVGVLLVSSLLAGWILSKLAVPKLKDLDFLGLDRGLGILLGLARGMLVVMLVIEGVKLTGFNREPIYRQSILVTKIQPLNAWAYKRFLVLGSQIKNKGLISHVRYSGYHGEIRSKSGVV